MLQTFCDAPYFTVFNILTITSSFLNEIEMLFFIRMISKRSSTNSESMKSFQSTFCFFLWLPVHGSILQQQYHFVVFYAIFFLVLKLVCFYSNLYSKVFRIKQIYRDSTRPRSTIQAYRQIKLMLCSFNT